MAAIQHIATFLEQFAPPRLAEEWDNVGLLVGDAGQSAERVMTCLSVSPTTVAEAISRRARLIVSHHPFPFHSLKRLTADNTVGRLLLDLIAAGVAVYSPHTSFDSAAEGINERLAAGLGLRGIVPLVPHAEGQGVGRYGFLDKAMTLEELATRLKSFLAISGLLVVGDGGRPVRLVGVGCGAADELLGTAEQVRCDAMVLGEARFHTCLAAEAAGIGLLLPGHFASERFGIEWLAEVLARKFPDSEVWASRSERDPTRWIA